MLRAFVVTATFGMTWSLPPSHKFLSAGGKHTRSDLRIHRGALIADIADSGVPVLADVNASIIVAPAVLNADVANVTVQWSGVPSPNRTTDWIGQVCVGYPIESYLEYAKIDAEPRWATGAGSLTFTVFRARCSYEFRYFRGKQPLWPSGVVIATSNPLTWAGDPAAPFHVHSAFAGDAATSMTLSFSTAGPPQGVVVQLGTSSGAYDMPNATDAETTTYSATDLCNAPANETSPDYYQPPGYFTHVLISGLQPATRYFARPVANGAPGPEASFITAAAASPNADVTFAVFGDMSVTQWDYWEVRVLRHAWYLCYKVHHPPLPSLLHSMMQNGTVANGPGAVGTSFRVRELIDRGGSDAPSFILHIGDLGYAKGYVAMWDSWMSMMTPMGIRAPYMISSGNHEYDYRYPSPRDPSGAGAMWRPSWWDGDVDSLGECGVGMAQRFRAPLSLGSNGIFWYAFETGSVTVVTLSSEHDLSPNSSQGIFLERTLGGVDRARTPWLVVTQHRHMYHLSGAEAEQQRGYLDLLEPVFRRHHVDLVVMGHTHNTLRTCAVYNYTCTPGAPVYVIRCVVGVTAPWRDAHSMSR